MYCNPDGDNWACYCEGGGGSFPVVKGEDAIDSCAAAIPTCAEYASPGNNGGIIFEDVAQSTSGVSR
jgi:hypothetical protein